ncbi:GGDEF domain-containing protein [Pseudoalteromonas phenolica]|uniref:diguanylate cyclase n=2 Tax=Pseudoalteromonas phenolica TaxID=161398 RepID=A0A0S2K0F4_9GAMM|nr:GGDEF domain-containing protein [Pseudoalteromonas phenolica]ALO41755.1 diguanylate cyclase [Pseudoalteromonas phenolica]MBE0353690.1 hypothetical protein [Pseudoalteromonas phenolica O-BC30]
MIKLTTRFFALFVIFTCFEVISKTPTAKVQTKSFAELPAKLEVYKKAVFSTYDLKLLPNLKALEQEAKALDNKKVQAEAMLLIALLQRLYGDYRESLILKQGALDIAIELAEPAFLINVYLSIIRLELSLERNKQAAEKMQSIDILINQLPKNSHLISRVYLWKARLFFAQESYLQASYIIDEALKKENMSKKVYIDLLIEKVKVKLKLGKFGIAQELLNQINQVNQGSQIQHTQLVIKVLQAEAYLQAGMFAKAILMAQDGLQSTFHTRFLEEQAQLQYTLASSFAQIQDYQWAHLYLKRYAFTQKALDLQKRNNKLLQLEARFDFDQQRQQLSLLEKDNALKEQKITQQMQAIENTALLQQRVILIVVLLFTLLFFMYWRWQNKRTLKMLEQQVAQRTQELAIRNKQLQALSYTDSLTGAYNRHFLFTHIDEYLPTEILTESTIMCLIDIDFFKRVNDTYGHSAGDTVLKSFVTVLKQTIRQNDVIIRWGGEEFLLLMPNISRDSAAEILERIRVNIETYEFIDNDINIPITASFGFTSYPLHRSVALLDWEQTIELADVCLYMSKNGGRNAWVGVTEANIENTLSAEEIVNGTKQLIEQGKLKVISNREDILSTVIN